MASASRGVTASPLPLLLLAMVLIATGAQSARVLIYLPTGGKSMKNLFYGVGSALVDRGHEVVFFNSFKPSSPVKGIKEIVPQELSAIVADNNLPNAFQMQKLGVKAIIKPFYHLLVDSARAALFSKELDTILTEKFDVVITGIFGYHAYVVPYLLKAPFIVMTPIPYMPVLNGPLGNPSLPAINPLPFTANTDSMTFIQRVKNTIGHAVVHVIMRFLYMPYCDRVVASKFGHGVIPPAAEIERNVSLIFSSSNNAFDYPKPLLPNVVQVGGAHCTSANPLPKFIRSFLGDSEFIFFSLGSVARSEDMGAELRAAVLRGLGALPFKVLLKWDSADRSSVPTNVLPSTWLPQQDLLGSGRCRLFITHGGFASVLESLCHGVPMLTIPFGTDQDYNANNIVRMGVALKISWDGMTAETLPAAARAALSPELLAASQYRRRLFDSQPIPPRDLATYWVEHVIEHGGAPHLRSVAADLYWFQYYSLDVLAFLLVVMMLLVKVFLVVVKWCCACLCGCLRKRDTSQKVQRKDRRPKRE